MCLPYDMLDFGASLIFDMFPAVSCLRDESMTAKIFRGLSLSASVGQHLRELDLNVRSFGHDLALLLDNPDMSLASLSL